MSEDVSQWDNLVGGYPLDEENLQEIEATQTRPVYTFPGNLPEKIDPREHPEAGNGFLQVENQGSIGSCQGQSLTECAEYCYYVASGLVIQFSRMFAYLTSQMIDGIRRDAGSTLSGGTRAAKQYGFCPEKNAPYPSRYPGWGWVTDTMKELASKFKLNSHTVIKSAAEAKQYLGSGIGILQWGLSWGRAMDPDPKGFIDGPWRAGRGGHAVVLAGYVPDSVVGRQSSAGYWFLLKNSWGRRWGDNGYAYVDPKVVDESLRHRWTVLLGRSDMQTPHPREVDFVKQPRFGFISLDFLVTVFVVALGTVVAVVCLGCDQPKVVKQVDRSWIPAIADPVESVQPGEELDRPRKGHKAIVIHTLAPGQCPPCEYWKKYDKPVVLKAGVDVVVLPDARRAPTFDLFDGEDYTERISGYKNADTLLDRLDVQR